MANCPNCKNTAVTQYCKATDVEYFTTADTYTFFECADCGILFIDPMPISLLATIYPANYYSFTNMNRSISFRIKDWLDAIFYKKILKKIPGQALRVLDVGGGTGTLLDSVKRADKRVSFTQVVDLDANAKTIAERKGHQYYQGPIENFEDPHGYDVILMLNLIEHVADPAAVLSKAAALLNTNGVIIIKTPNYQSLDARLFRNTYWGGLHCPRHWVIFSRDSFSKLSHQCHLSIRQFSYTQGAPFWSFSILNWLHAKKWITADKERPIIYHPLFGVISVCAAAIDFARKPFAPLSQMFFVLSKKNN